MQSYNWLKRVVALCAKGTILGKASIGQTDGTIGTFRFICRSKQHIFLPSEKEMHMNDIKIENAEIVIVGGSSAWGWRLRGGSFSRARM